MALSGAHPCLFPRLQGPFFCLFPEHGQPRGFTSTCHFLNTCLLAKENPKSKKFCLLNTSIFLSASYIHISSLEKKQLARLVWLSGLSTRLQTERLLVQFPVRAHAWVAGQIPISGYVRGVSLTHEYFFVPSL